MIIILFLDELKIGIYININIRMLIVIVFIIFKVIKNINE